MQSTTTGEIPAARPRARSDKRCATGGSMFDVKFILASALLVPLLSVKAINTEAAILAWAVIGSSQGAYCLVASEVIAMLLGERKLPVDAKRLWWALAILRFTVGLPLGAFCALVYAAYNPEAHLWVIGAVAYVFGWSGIALKPALDRVLNKRIEGLA